jgi:hypothetical protein
MHWQGVEAGGRSLAEEAIAAGGMMRVKDPPTLEWTECEEEFKAGPTAMNGLAVAILFSAALWMVIGVTIWALAR